MTSYSYYSENNITQANACQAETIYGLGGTATISPTLLEKYRYSASYTLDGSETTAGYKAGQSWGPHTITATYTFDGVTVTSDPLTCHVTGLPYTAAPPTNSGEHPWSGNANSWGTSNVRIYSDTITQTFDIPSNINVYVTYDTLTKSQGAKNYFWIYAGGIQIDSFNNYNSNFFKGKTYKNSNKIEGTLTTEKKDVTCEGKIGNTGGSGSDANYIEINSILVEYR